jgi:hypothetical protein
VVPPWDAQRHSRLKILLAENPGHNFVLPQVVLRLMNPYLAVFLETKPEVLLS